MSISQALQELEDWPVDNVAAAVIAGGAGGEVTTHGDTAKVFPLASVTKPLSAYGFLMAIEEGIFELDTPLGPEGATVRHLLAHASGLASQSDEVERPPADRRIYSAKVGFDILADTVSQEAGMSFAEYLSLGVFEPLGMTSTKLDGSAGSGAESNVDDLIIFVRELLAPKLLAEETVREAFTPQFPDLRGIVPGYGMQKPNPWGLGFEIKGSKSEHWTGPSMPADTVGHFGMTGTYLWAVPSWADAAGAGTGMVVLTDRDFGDWAKPLWSETNEAVFGKIAG